MPLSKNAKRRRDAAANAAQRKRVNLCAGDPTRPYTTPHWGELPMPVKAPTLHVSEAEGSLMRGCNMTRSAARRATAEPSDLPLQEVVVTKRVRDRVAATAQAQRDAETLRRIEASAERAMGKPLTLPIRKVLKLR